MLNAADPSRRRTEKRVSVKGWGTEGIRGCVYYSTFHRHFKASEKTVSSLFFPLDDQNADARIRFILTNADGKL